MTTSILDAHELQARRHMTYQLSDAELRKRINFAGRCRHFTVAFDRDERSNRHRVRFFNQEGRPVITFWSEDERDLLVQTQRHLVFEMEVSAVTFDPELNLDAAIEALEQMKALNLH